MWNWAGNALLQLIVTALYIVVFAIITLCVSFLFSTKGDKKLKAFFREQKEELDTKLQRSEEYLALQKMNVGVEEGCRSYPKRMVLAALSAMTGETDVRTLCRLAEAQDETWLRYDYSAYAFNSYHQNKHVLSLARADASDAKLAMAYVLYERSVVRNAGSSTQSNQFGEYAFLMNKNPDFLENTIKTAVTMRHSQDYQGLVIEKPADHLLDLPLRFLEAECETARCAGNYAYMGEVCRRLYHMGKDNGGYGGREDMLGIAYRYGRLGVEYSDKLKFYVMKEYAVYDETWDRQKSLGFHREDAEAYCKELYQKSDPRWREMRDALDRAKKDDAEYVRECDAREAQREREAELAERRREEEAKQARHRELEKKADWLERDLDLMRGGSGHTVEELRIMGQVSDRDAMDYADLREHVIDKKSE